MTPRHNPLTGDYHCPKCGATIYTGFEREVADSLFKHGMDEEIKRREEEHRCPHDP